MNGKNKCKILKEIRREIAEANDIPLEIPECTYEGDCPGTCPQCEEELNCLTEAVRKIRDGDGSAVIPRFELKPEPQESPERADRPSVMVLMDASGYVRPEESLLSMWESLAERMKSFQADDEAEAELKETLEKLLTPPPPKSDRIFEKKNPIADKTPSKGGKNAPKNAGASVRPVPKKEKKRRSSNDRKR